LLAFVRVCRALLTERAAIAAESLSLRQQINVLQRSVSRPRLRPPALLQLLERS
jgi:hypothetical protein